MRHLLVLCLVLLGLPFASSAGQTVSVDPGVLDRLETDRRAIVIVTFEASTRHLASVGRDLDNNGDIRILRISATHPEISARISSRGLRQLLQHRSVRTVYRPLELTPAMQGDSVPRTRLELAASR